MEKFCEGRRFFFRSFCAHFIKLLKLKFLSSLKCFPNFLSPVLPSFILSFHCTFRFDCLHLDINQRITFAWRTCQSIQNKFYLLYVSTWKKGDSISCDKAWKIKVLSAKQTIQMYESVICMNSMITVFLMWGIFMAFLKGI